VDYAALLAAIRAAFPGSELEPVAEEKLAAIRERHPGAPDSYLEFLRHVGFGRIGRMGLFVYDGLCEPSEFLDPSDAACLPGVLLFADDFGGWHAGFDTRDGWKVVGVSSAAPSSVPEQAASIGEFVAQWVGDRV
jgi:hypothetical protein